MENRQNNEEKNIFAPEPALDLALRPRRWGDFLGQEKIKNNLKIILEAAKKRSEPPDHLLFYGQAGLGKTTLAHLVALELGSDLKITSGPAVEKAGDLASILTNLSDGDILFIDEIHRLNKLIEEMLYSAMESRTLNIVLGKGPSARTVQLELPPFTLVAATTRAGLLSGPLRSRFGAIFRLDFYEENEIALIIKKNAELLNVKISAEGAETLSKASRATPRVANRLLKRSRDLALVEGGLEIDENIAKRALDLFGIDELGLEEGDRRMLETIIDKFGGGPVGINALAAAANEEKDTVEDLYEPYLMRIGFLERTTKGRVVTDAAYQHLNLYRARKKQENLFNEN